ncbi:MAG TPA: nitrite reductase small subunit NirD [Pseudomonadales bacterium]|jgi:nitrite reductase (NADH) small subunit
MSQWITVCHRNDVVANAGRCALIDGKQVALFRIVRNHQETWFAVQNYDPYSDANVLSRGIVGCTNNTLFVASPIYKQRFALATGQSLEDSDITLETWPVEIRDDRVQVMTHQQQAA